MFGSTTIFREITISSLKSQLFKHSLCIPGAVVWQHITLFVSVYVCGASECVCSCQCYGLVRVLTGLYNRDGVCLLRGTDWVFKLLQVNLIL